MQSNAGLSCYERATGKVRRSTSVFYCHNQCHRMKWYAHLKRSVRHKISWVIATRCPSPPPIKRVIKTEPMALLHVVIKLNDEISNEPYIVLKKSNWKLMDKTTSINQKYTPYHLVCQCIAFIKWRKRATLACRMKHYYAIVGVIVVRINDAPWKVCIPK